MELLITQKTLAGSPTVPRKAPYVGKCFAILYGWVFVCGRLFLALWSSLRLWNELKLVMNKAGGLTLKTYLREKVYSQIRLLDYYPGYSFYLWLDFRVDIDGAEIITGLRCPKRAPDVEEKIIAWVVIGFHTVNRSIHSVHLRVRTGRTAYLKGCPGRTVILASGRKTARDGLGGGGYRCLRLGNLASRASTWPVGHKAGGTGGPPREFAYITGKGWWQRSEMRLLISEAMA